MTPLTAPKIRWGLANTGRMAEWFCRDFSHVDDGEIVAVASRSPSRSDHFSRIHDIDRAYPNFNALLDAPDVDVIYISSPHSLHAGQARAALEAGKAVVCEKPLTTHPDEAERLIDVAHDTDGYLMEAMWTHFLPAIKMARTWYHEGRIGRIHHLKADFGYPQKFHPKQREYDPDLGGGALLEMGIYPVALAWYVLERDPESVQVLGRRAPNGVDDDVTAIFDYPATADHPSCTATLGTSYRCKLQNWAYLIGEDGYIAIPDFWRASECHLYVLDERVDSFYDLREHQGFSFEANAVNADLRAGRRQSPIVPLTSSLRFQQHLAQIRTQLDRP